MNKTWVVLLLFLFLQACDSSQKSKEQQEVAGESSYKGQCEVQHAKGFDIQYFDQYKIITIKSADSTAAGEKFILLENGRSRPEGYPEAQVIQIPVKSMVGTSSMHTGLLETLGSTDVLTGLAGSQYVYSPSVQRQIKAGKIVEVGKDNGLNLEKLIEMHPDLVMTVGSPGTKADRFTALREAGIPVLTNSEWVETTPLARCEWIKLAAALLNKEKEANAIFGKIERDYNHLARLARTTDPKPTVISGLNTKDVWFLPKGDNYMSQFFKDAGASYHWADTKGGGSLSLNFEAVYPIALKAQYWINVGFDKNNTRKSILEQDSRYADFSAAKSRKMYSYNARVNASGSNDFFESGAFNPHIVLADLIHIFHPGLLPGHQLVYYKQLP
ncbi:ABC transporter substrate-binding protein [Dyadobacter crusticola]|uniref:ABC transporter substrate-binding protein n=1 Tax=Dyadobacter crusticola TaxID=292407 RepID=UPI0004E270AB|nr:ABC transporter substrate-binding protein [Dyadobacter crusticola]